jgi:Carboxypeptidase regulatory-like domain/TonB dependent receptor
MKLFAVALCLLSIPIAAFSQAANGTITGTVTDASGAAVAGAAIDVTNADTGVDTPTVSTPTGAYTVPNLPIGAYSVTVTAPGFKRYNRAGLALAAAQKLEIDIPLEVGATNESVTVTAEASLLKTETGDVAHNVTLEQLDDLPVLGIGGANAGSSGVRNPYNSMVMVPGIVYNPNFTMIVNGAPSNTAAYRVEGMDNTNHTVSYALQENQPSADAIQEVAIQTSNYAPEFGQAGGGLFNVTMKSGTNQYHGSGYDYFVNEDLNAGYPFSSNGMGGKYRPRNRRNDFGGTFGGPVRIPKIYNGTNKTFFFFNYEEFLETSGLSFSDTVPTTAFRNGDFSAISPAGGANFNTALGVPAGSLGTDALGRPIFANEIYDPTTRGVAPNGLGYSNPFPNNMIPQSMFSPYAKAVLALIPMPSNGQYINNYNGYNLGQRTSRLPSVKVDQALGAKGKLSFYWGLTGTDSQFSSPNGNADGLPNEITQARGTFIHSLTERLNYDYTLTPTLLIHLGAGYSRTLFVDTAPYTKEGNTVNCLTDLNLPGCQVSFNFPTVNSTVSTLAASTLGGMQQMGNALVHTTTTTLRPSFNANTTWIHENHTFKFGGEVWFQGNITAPPSGVGMNFGCSASLTCTATNLGATAQPYTVPAGLAGQQMGNFFANFLLGDAVSTTQYAPVDARMGKSQWAVYAQDSWKITRKLTVDYGLRWDLATPSEEQYGRSADLGVNVANPAVGGRLGAPIFQQTCNCDFMKTYKLAFGPRLGVAYQLDPKTVFRGGWGIVYGFAPDIANSSSAQQTSTITGTNGFVNVLSPGAIPQPTWPNFNPGQTPLPGQIAGFTGFTFIDPNAARPPRQNQWSVGIQREITHDFVLDASYVGNQGVWWPGPLGLLNQVSPATFAAYGLNPYTNPADNLLLSSPLSSPAVIARVGNLLPYSGYSTANTLLNALRPFPQFSTIAVTDSPTGKTWYNSLQMKGTKRMAKGLQVNGTFTWSKAEVFTREDIFNPASSSKSIQATDQPFLFTANILYVTQKYFGNRWSTLITKDWQAGAFLQYGSGLPLTPPAATTTNNLGSSEQIPTGQPFFLKNLNCGCINPLQDQVLNPAAWTNPAAGTFGPGPTTLYYTNFRQARRPLENFNLARNFRIKERYNLQIRAEFVNIFNRTQIGNPSTSNPAGPLTRNAAGQVTGGFGAYNLALAANATPSVTSNGVVGQLYGQPRQGTLVARFTF